MRVILSIFKRKLSIYNDLSKMRVRNAKNKIIGANCHISCKLVATSAKTLVLFLFLFLGFKLAHKSKLQFHSKRQKQCHSRRQKQNLFFCQLASHNFDCSFTHTTQLESYHIFSPNGKQQNP